MKKFTALDTKKEAQKLEPCDYIIVDSMLWRVVRTIRSMGTPSQMLQLAYHTHAEPKSFKFHPVRPEERFEVFQEID